MTNTISFRELMLTKAPVSGHSKKHALDPEEVRKKLDDGCELNVTELLRLRVRYLSDGVAIGSAQFVNEIFTEFRDRFSVTIDRVTDTITPTHPSERESQFVIPRLNQSR